MTLALPRHIDADQMNARMITNSMHVSRMNVMNNGGSSIDDIIMSTNVSSEMLYIINSKLCTVL